MTDEPKKANGQKEGEVTPLEKQVSRMNETLEAMQKQNFAQSKVLEDPDVRDLMARKAKGEEVIIGTKEKKAEKTPEEAINELLYPKGKKPEGDAFEGLSNQELIEHVAEMMQKGLAQATEQATKPLKDELEAMRGEKAEEKKAQGNQALADEVLAVAKKYKDFDDHKEGMADLYEQGTSVEDLYLLSKIKKIGLPTETPESELPFNFLGTNRREAPKTTRHGSRGFRDIVNEATTKQTRG